MEPGLSAEPETTEGGRGGVASGELNGIRLWGIRWGVRLWLRRLMTRTAQGDERMECAWLREMTR